MTHRVQDKFDRTDGDIGDNYLVACGAVMISDEAVIPLDGATIVSGQAIPSDATVQKTQVFYNLEAMDGPDYVVRTTWAHDAWEPSRLDVNTAASFSALARMTKDPVLYDLGVEEDPSCYDQGYGARVTFPLSGSAPVLKIIKLMPLKRLPGLSRPSSTEVDGSVVLISATLNPDDLNLDPDFDSDAYTAGDLLPYKGFWQDMRLRIRRMDNEVILDVYLNDRNLNQARLSYTDRQDPLWGAIGLPGFEFLSSTLDTQPPGVSPYALAGVAALRCGIFSTETFRDVRRPVRVTPGSFFTYREVTNRVITLVEKDGDAKYNATTGAASKFSTYLTFVMEAEADIIRKEGYYNWLRREQRIYLAEETTTYELPSDLGLLEQIRPGNWNSTPLVGMDKWAFHQRLGGLTQGNGRPTIYTAAETGTDSRQTIRLFPVPAAGSITESSEAPFIVVDYFARQLRPDEPDIQIPYVPQEHIDVLVYGAAAHAMLLDTDDNNAQRMAGVYQSKLKDLRRANNRMMSGQHAIARSAADVFAPGLQARGPVLRSTQLSTLLVF